MPKKIFIIQTVWPHWAKFSGINQFIRYIDKNNYKIEVYFASHLDQDFPLQSLAIINFLKEILAKRGMQWYSLSSFTAEIKAIIKCLSKRIDVIHYLDGEHATLLLPLIFPIAKRRTKLVATFHQPADILREVVNKDVVRRLDAVIVVSPEQIPYFEEFMDSEKIYLILHGIDTIYYKPDNKSSNDGIFKCITVGHWLRDYVSIRSVAQNLSSYYDIEFHVVSSSRVGPENLGLEDLGNVFLYKESISDEHLLQMYQQSDILFLPLIQSTANNSLLEGLSCGLPIVSTLLPSVKIYVPGEEAILIEDNDVNQLSDAVLYLYKNPSERQRMSRASRKRAMELDWQRIAPLYEAVYSHITAE